MKVGQKSIVRWVAKLVSPVGRRTAQRDASKFQALDSEQLRHVAGGSGTTTTPYKGW
jgi:hypothetical protein